MVPASTLLFGVQSRAHRYITDNVPCNENNPLAYLDISIDGQPGETRCHVSQDVHGQARARARGGGGG
jgi:hypothetical protein